MSSLHHQEGGEDDDWILMFGQTVPLKVLVSECSTLLHMFPPLNQLTDVVS